MRASSEASGVAFVVVTVIVAVAVIAFFLR